MRENGFLLLDEKIIKIKKKKKNGTHYGFWISYNQEEYYFKTGTEYELYMELFCEEIANLLMIPTASYDLAKLNGREGVISKNINPKNKKEITIYKILEEYYENVITKNINLFPDEIFIENTFNLEDVWWALEYHYRNNKNKEQIVKNLMNQIVDSFILQVLTFNSDLNFENMMILESENPVLAANIDYGRGGLIDLKLPVHNYFFSVIPFNMKEKKDAKEIIQDFINLSDSIFIMKLEKCVSILNPNSLRKALKNIETKTNYLIPDHIKEYLYYGFYEKILIIQNLINKKMNLQKR